MTDPTDAVVPVHPSPIAVNAWWNDDDDDEVEGYDLLRDEALLQLVGVPFKGTKVIFRDGTQRKGIDYRDDYASLELRVAPEAVLMQTMTRILTRRRALKVPDNTPIADGDENLVLNDGSTGAYRQIVQYLVAKGHVTLPEGPEEGEKGDSVLDLPRSQWLTGAEEATKGIEIKLKCPRGLRFSDYTNEYLPEGQTARTWYIA